MMTTFCILAAVMAVIAAAAVAVPLWRGRGSADQDEAERREQVLTILRHQAEELERDHAAGRIDRDEYEETRAELETRVLDETRTANVADHQNTVMTKTLAVVLALVIPASAVFCYWMLGRYQAMDPMFIEMVENQQRQTGGHSQADMLEELKNLEDKLAKKPDDPEGWYMLAQGYASMERFTQAAEAYAKLNELMPRNANLMADWADMIAAANGRVVTPEAKKILEDALQIDPVQWKALALLAILGWETEDYESAANYWERLLKCAPDALGSPDQLKANIEEARRLAKEVSEGKRPGQVNLPEVKTAQIASVSGRVEVAEGLKERLQPGDAVFIYARPEKGSRMPVAYMKIEAKDLPYEFVLTNEMGMAMGENNLDDAGTVFLGARISSKGNFMPQDGDLEGELKVPVRVGTTDNVIVVDKVHRTEPKM